MLQMSGMRGRLFTIVSILIILSASLVIVHTSDSNNSEAANGDVITVDGVKYNILNGSSVEVGTGNWQAVDPNSTIDLYIPSTIVYGGKTYNVTSVGAAAFQSTHIKSITFGSSESPISLNSIKSSAFYSAAVESVTIYGSVNTIVQGSFQRCTELTSFSVNGNIGTIGSAAFDYCTSLDQFYVSGSIGTINSNAFDHTSNPFTFTVLGNISSIGTSAFWNSSVEYVTVGGNVTSVENNAFQQCDNVVSVNMGSVGSIGSWAFGESTLEYITLSNTSSIGNGAFQTSQLNEVYITDAGSNRAHTLINSCFSSNSWVIGGKTITTLIVDDISKISNIGNGGTIIYYDETSGSCYTYTYVNGSWVVSPSTSTIVVVFEPQSESVSVSSVILTSGSTVTFPTVYKVDCELIGWFSLPSGGVQYTESTIFTSNTVAYAHWRSTVATYYNVTYDLNGGSGTVPSEISVIGGGSFTVDPCTGTKTGYFFIGWSDGVEAYQPGSTYTVEDSDVVLTALWWLDELEFVVHCTDVYEYCVADNNTVSIGTSTTDMHLSSYTTYGANITVTFDSSAISLTIGDSAVLGCLPVVVVISNSDGTVLISYFIEVNILPDSYFVTLVN